MTNALETLSLKQKIKQGLAYHIVDSTAMMAISTPLFAGIERQINGMSQEGSINARLLCLGLTYAGMGRLFSKGLDTSRKLFKIKPETKERMKKIHDAGYMMAYNLVISPIFYYASGIRDIKQIAIGTGMALGCSAVLGGPAGYVIDAYRDLSGIKSSERIPKSIQERSPTVKKGLAALVTAAAAGLTVGIYQLSR